MGLEFLFYLIVKPILLLKDFLIWFYITFLPLIIKYFGIPLFLLGIILAIAFTGSSLFFIVVFFIFMYYFIRGTIFNNPVTQKYFIL